MNCGDQGGTEAWEPKAEATKNNQHKQPDTISDREWIGTWVQNGNSKIYPHSRSNTTKMQSLPEGQACRSERQETGWQKSCKPHQWGNACFPQKWAKRHHFLFPGNSSITLRVSTSNKFFIWKHMAFTFIPKRIYCPSICVSFQYLADFFHLLQVSVPPDEKSVIWGYFTFVCNVLGLGGLFLYFVLKYLPGFSLYF